VPIVAVPVAVPADQIKGELEAAEFGGRPVAFVGPQTTARQVVIRGAQQLASSTT